MALASSQAQVEAVPQVRALISRIVLTPAERRGVDIKIEGRIDQMLGLAGELPADLRKRANAG